MDCIVDVRVPVRPVGATARDLTPGAETRLAYAASTGATTSFDAVLPESIRKRAGSARHPWHTRVGGLGLALAINAIVVALLLTTAPTRQALRSALPFKVSVLTLPVEEATLPTPLPPKVMRKLLHRDAPARTVAPVFLDRLPEFVPPEIAAPQFTPPAITTTVETSPPPAPMPAAVPPRFDADYLQNPAPAYPPVSRRLGEQGKVMLRVLVGSNGLPEKIELQVASGSDRLDQAAIDTVARWRFVPARQGDTAISGWVLIPITFALKT